MPSLDNAINYMDHMDFLSDDELDIYLTMDIEVHLAISDPI